MTRNEKELAMAIMNGDYRIELSDDLVSSVRRIKDPSEVVWGAVFSALVASAFFWGGAGPLALGIAVGLPAILAICGGVGGIVFVTLGADGTMCAYKMLAAAQTIDVLTKLRNDYKQDGNILMRK
ncbi:MAG: hypothetical protein ACI35Y_06630 [Candidatus Limimorpha sp.]